MAADTELPGQSLARCHRLWETGCCCCSRCRNASVIAPSNRTAPHVLSTVTLPQQTTRQQDRRYSSHNCAWNFEAVILLVCIVLALITSFAAHSVAAPLHGSRKLRALSTTEVARISDRSSNNLRVQASTAFPANFLRKYSGNFLRDTVRHTVSDTWKNSDIKSREEEKNSNDTALSPRGMSWTPESKHAVLESSRASVSPRIAGGLAESPKGRIVVRREALSENSETTAGSPPTDSVNDTSAVFDMVSQRLASESSHSSSAPPYGSSPVNSDTEIRTQSTSFSDSTTTAHDPTAFEVSPTDEISVLLRNAMEEAFRTAQIDPGEETQKVSQTTKSEETSSATNDHMTTNEIKTSFTTTTTAYVRTPVTAWDQNRSSTIAKDVTTAIGPSVKSDISAATEHYLVTVSSSALTAETSLTSVQRDITLAGVSEERHIATSLTTVDALGTSAFSSSSNQHPETAATMSAMFSSTRLSGSGTTTGLTSTASWAPETSNSRTTNVTASLGISAPYVPVSGTMSTSPASSTAGEPSGATTPEAIRNTTFTAFASHSATAIADPSRSTVTTWTTEFASDLSTAARAAGSTTTTVTSAILTTLLMPLTTPGTLFAWTVPNANVSATSSASTFTRHGEIPSPQTSSAAEVTATALAIDGSEANQTTLAFAGTTVHVLGGNSTKSSPLPFARVSLSSGATVTTTLSAASTDTPPSASSETGSPITNGEPVTMSTSRAVNATAVDTVTSAHATFGHSTVTSPAPQDTSESGHGGTPSSTVTTEIDSYTAAVSAESSTFATNVSVMPSAAITPAPIAASAASSTELITKVVLSTPSTMNWTVSAQSTVGQPVLSQAWSSPSSATGSGDQTSRNATFQTTNNPTFNVTLLAMVTAVHSLSAESSQSEPMGHTTASEPTTTAIIAKNSTVSSNQVLPPTGAAFQESTSGSTVGQLLAWAIPVSVLGAAAVIGVVIAVAFIRKRRGSMWLHHGGRRNDGGAIVAEATRSGGDYDSVGSP